MAEAAFALLYFQRTTDLIPDPIPDIGLLDNAIIVGMVLQRPEHAFKQSPYANMHRWPEPKFEVEELLSVISPLRGVLVLLIVGEQATDLIPELRQPLAL